MIFENDIQAKNIDKLAHVRGFFGVFDDKQNFKGAFKLKKDAVDWINSWVFEGKDTSFFTVKKIEKKK